MRQLVQDVELRPLFRALLKLGCLGFEGTAAHLALMEKEIVLDRRWLEPGEFLDLMARRT